MYEITGNSATFKLSEQEKEVFNEVALTMQTIENREFTNSKQVVFALISDWKHLKTELETLKSNLKTTEIEPKTTENNPEIGPKTLEIESEIEPKTTVSEIENENEIEFSETENHSETKLKIIESISEILGTEYNPTDEELYTDILEIITTPLEPAPTVEIQKEVVKEVERQLSENEFLLSLKPQQTQVLKTIARWRFISKKDSHTNAIPELILRMLFNKGVLLNWHGQFATGIPETKIA